ncbi:MAG TPA: urease accessory UreF family protein [Kiritimatiellia bacterium]|jgi:urease accessory protein
MFPTGAYAHSFGLEALVEHGTVQDEPSLRRYLADVMVPSLAGTDLPIVHAAWQAASARDAARLVELDDLAEALRPTRELRDASRRTGSQRLQTLLELDPRNLLREFVDLGGKGHAPVVYGIECALWSVPERSALQAFAYQAVAGLVSAAFKLIPLGQMAAQRLIADLAESLETHVDDALRIAPDDAGWFAPMTDIASSRHEQAYTRLFIS